MKCIIIDDEPLARKGIHLLSEKLGSLDIIAEFSSAIEANTFLSEDHEVDLIFLDIEMPGLTGIEFLRAVPRNAQVILTTAYPQYALEAFELDVTDYLLKPIKFDRFMKAINKVREIIQSRNTKFSLEKTEEEFVYIKSDRKYVRLFFKDILYIKGLKDYVMIYSNEGKYMTAMNVGTMMKNLPEVYFARVSKSFIINIDRIIQIDTDFVYLQEVEIPLGASYKEEFIKNHVKDKLISR